MFFLCEGNVKFPQIYQKMSGSLQHFFLLADEQACIFQLKLIHGKSGK